MIYDIKNTEEALAFGAKATPAQAMELKKAAGIYQAQFIVTREKGDDLLKNGLFDRLMIIATHKQLCDEALYAYESNAEITGGFSPSSGLTG